MALKAIVTREAPAALLRLCGSLDCESARVLRLKAQSLLATGHTHLVLDLSKVTAFDDAGGEVLRYVLRIFALAEGRVALRGIDLDLEARLIAIERPAPDAPDEAA